jgi:hypothetical protein
MAKRKGKPRRRREKPPKPEPGLHFEKGAIVFTIPWEQAEGGVLILRLSKAGPDRANLTVDGFPPEQMIEGRKIIGEFVREAIIKAAKVLGIEGDLNVHYPVHVKWN